MHNEGALFHIATDAQKGQETYSTLSYQFVVLKIETEKNQYYSTEET